MADVFNISDYHRKEEPEPSAVAPSSNGSRQVLLRYFVGQPEELVDRLIIKLWVEGFKIVPLDGTEK